MSSRVVSFASCASLEPPREPVWDTTSPASASSFRMRRITTGLVFTLSATCSDLRGSSPDQAIKLKTCTATANLLFVDISNCPGNHAPPFCNHYRYKLDFVNYLRELGFLPRGGTNEHQWRTTNGSRDKHRRQH